MPKLVQNFLNELGLAEYTGAFHEQGVDYDLLGSLTDEDLRELGVDKLGHRKRILVAAAQIEAVASGEASVRKRLLTLMFADLVDSTALSTQIPLEDYHAHIRRFQDAAKDTVEKYGGYIAKFYGDGVLAYFGYQLYLAVEDVDHTKTKANSSQTNGICERFHRTIKDEFYDIAFRKKLYRSVEELQTDLDAWLAKYNEQRPHSGRHCYGKTPMQTFRETLHIAVDKTVSASGTSDSQQPVLSTVR